MRGVEAHLKKGLSRIGSYLRWMADARYRKRIVYFIVGAAILYFIAAHSFNIHLLQRYKDLESPAILDRHGTLLTLQPNEKQEYGRYVDTLPARVKEILVAKEDRFFF